MLESVIVLIVFQHVTLILELSIILIVFHLTFKLCINYICYGCSHNVPVVEKVLKGQMAEACAENLDPVMDAYEHAMLAKFPWARYPVGLDANYVLVPMTVCSLIACVLYHFQAAPNEPQYGAAQIRALLKMDRGLAHIHEMHRNVCHSMNIYKQT